MSAPPANASHGQVVQWLNQIGFLTNLSKLVEQYRSDINQPGVSNLTSEHISNLEYFPATATTPDVVLCTATAVPIVLTPRIETLAGLGQCYTEWVLPLNGVRDGEAEHVQGWGPDYYRQEFMSADGQISLRERREVVLSGHNFHICMRPHTQAPVPHRFSAPLPLSQRQHPSNVPDPSRRPLPTPPQMSKQGVKYTYRTPAAAAPGMSGPRYTGHRIFAAVTFVNPHNPQAREAPPPTPLYSHAVNVLGWNDRTEAGHELGWEGEERCKGGNPLTPVRS
ncbi:hypothetical protein JCM6882_004162 [Rhodosporidiobolus microsporus]